MERESVVSKMGESEWCVFVLVRWRETVVRATLLFGFISPFGFFLCCPAHLP